MNAISGKLGITLTPSGNGVSMAILPPTALPIETLLCGKSRQQAARTLGLVYNICAAAQDMAARAAFDLPVSTAEGDAVRREGARDHIRSIVHTWPRALGMKPDPLAMGLPLSEMPEQIFGIEGVLPETWREFERWTQRGETIAAEVLAVILEAWPADWGLVDQPLFDPSAPVDWRRARQNDRAVENGPVCRLQGHPLLDAIRDRFGPGPLWRMAACLIDTQLMLQDDLLYARPISVAEPGVGGAHASRGIMMVKGQCDGDAVCAFARVSPTDFALAEEGLLNQSLASLTGEGNELIGFEAAVRLIVAVVDPCYPIDLTIHPRTSKTGEMSHA